jgi:hypothetical protein
VIPQDRSGAAVARSAARGVIAAMAMTGMRRVTTGLGLLEQTPPDAMAEQEPTVSRLLDRIPPDYRDEAIELAHWAYGALGGAAFGVLVPRGLRTRWTGPLYGLAIWTLFETGLVPLLGLEHARERKVLSRVLTAADHLLYGTVVGSAPWPHRV